jgi:tetratricopeptide (TPR) repeat protein
VTLRGGAAVLLVLLVAASASAQMSRDAALKALGQADPEARRSAVTALAAIGTFDDVPRLAEALRDTDPLVRRLTERALWDVWSRSGDRDIDRLFAVGVEQMNDQQGPAAVQTFSEIIRRKPEFPEGWNKRATVYYLLGEYAKSLADCDEVMKRNPYHFGALSGYGMIYMEMNEPARALTYFERALAVNPNLESVAEAVQMLRRLLIQQRRDAV